MACVSVSVLQRNRTNGDTWTRKKRFVMGMGSQNDGGCWEGPQHAPRTLQNQEGRCSKARGPGAATPKGGRIIDVSAREREGKNVPSLHFLALVQPQWIAGSAPTVLDYSVFGLKCRWLSSGNTLAATPSIWASLTCSINSLPPARILGRLTASGKRQGPRGLHPSFSVSILAGRNTREASTTRLDRCSPPE